MIPLVQLGRIGVKSWQERSSRRTRPVPPPRLPAQQTVDAGGQIIAAPDRPSLSRTDLFPRLLIQDAPHAPDSKHLPVLAKKEPFVRVLGPEHPPIVGGNRHRGLELWPRERHHLFAAAKIGHAVEIEGAEISPVVDVLTDGLQEFRAVVFPDEFAVFSVKAGQKLLVEMQVDPPVTKGQSSSVDRILEGLVPEDFLGPGVDGHQCPSVTPLPHRRLAEALAQAPAAPTAPAAAVPVREDRHVRLFGAQQGKQHSIFEGHPLPRLAANDLLVRNDPFEHFTRDGVKDPAALGIAKVNAEDPAARSHAHGRGRCIVRQRKKLATKRPHGAPVVAHGVLSAP